MLHRVTRPRDFHGVDPGNTVGVDDAKCWVLVRESGQVTVWHIARVACPDIKRVSRVLYDRRTLCAQRTPARNTDIIAFSSAEPEGVATKCVSCMKKRAKGAGGAK